MAKPIKEGYYLYGDKEKIGYNADYWWLANEGDVHTQVFANSKEYFRKWSPNYYELVGHKNRYEERDVAVGINVSPWSKIRGAKYLSANVTASICDTLVSKVAKQVPSVQFVTSGGNWAEQQQAKDMEKYIQGIYLNQNVHGNFRQMFGDSCKVGTGFIVMDDYNGELCYYNYPAFACMCDWLDAQSGNPVDTHFVSVENRFKLMQLYPEHKEKLLQTTPSLHFFTETNLNSKDCVVMVRSFNTFAGRRAISVDNCTLRDDNTLMGDNGLKNSKGQPIPPFIYQIYKNTSFGMFSIGAAEEVRPLHEAVDKTLRIIQRSAHLCAVPKVWVNRASNIVETLLDNDIGSIVLHDGQPPTFSPMGIIPMDLYHLVEYYYNLAFKKVGLSELAATSQKPAGLDSGKALMTYFDIESDRFQSTTKMYERAVIDLSYLTVKYSRYLDKAGYKQKAKFYGQSIQKEINFADVDLDEEFYDIQAYPVSIIPSTPAGRYETVRDMLQLGLLDQQRTLKLLDIPDIQNDTDIENSQLDYVKYQIYCLMEGKGEIYPEERQDLLMVIDQAQKHYFYYKQKNPDPAGLARLSSFIEQAKNLQAERKSDAEIIAQKMLMQIQQQESPPTAA